MFIVSMALIVGGYTLLYYGVGMWEHYWTTNTQAGWPISYLFGFTKTIPTSAPALPFAVTSGGGTTGGSNPASPSTGTSGGSGVQTV